MLALLLTLALGPAQELPPLLPSPAEVKLEPAAGLKLPSELPWEVAPPWPEAEAHLGFVAAALLPWSHVRLRPQQDAEASRLLLRRVPSLAPSAYHLSLDPDRILIEAADLKGLAHATATLAQLWQPLGARLPAGEIHDAPANPYRSLMIDLGRHGMSLPTLVATLDLLWFYKLDSLHLHLTDDQRFAFPSQAFPKLQQGPGHLDREAWRQFASEAARRGITLIPELDVPGHSTLLRRHYPEVFGETPTELASLPSARQGLKTLLDEMMELFPEGPYVHIGGDEAYGVPAALQRELINHLAAHLRERGRSAIVWEGPGRGDATSQVDPAVIHMNWRTVNYPADQMLADGYRVINASWDPLYVVDHYPANNFTMAAPGYIYEQLKLTRFAHFNPELPTFAHPIEVEPTPALLGYLMPWWEGREANFLPLITPRLIAMAAVAWAEPKTRDTTAFAQAASRQEARRRELFEPLTWQAAPLAVPTAGVFWRSTTLSLARRPWLGLEQATIHYRLDGQAPTKDAPIYKEPLTLTESVELRAACFVDGRRVGHELRQHLTMVEPGSNLALGRPVTVNVHAGPFFCPQRLTDGGLGNLDQFLGYPAQPQPIAITVDLGAEQPIGEVLIHAYAYGDSYEAYRLLISTDGEQWQQVADHRSRPAAPENPVRHDLEGRTARYLRLLSEGHPGQVFASFSRLVEIEAFAPGAAPAAEER